VKDRQWEEMGRIKEVSGTGGGVPVEKKPDEKPTGLVDQRGGETLRVGTGKCGKNANGV